MNSKVISSLKATVEVLKPFYKITTILSGQKYTTLSIVLHSFYYLKKKLNVTHKDQLLSTFQANLLEPFNAYVEKYNIFDNPFLCCSTFLNPEYRDFSHCTDEERAKSKHLAIKFIKEYFKSEDALSEELLENSFDSCDSLKSKIK